MMTGLHHNSHKLFILRFKLLDSVLVQLHLFFEVLDAGSEVFDGWVVHNGQIQLINNYYEFNSAQVIFDLIANKQSMSKAPTKTRKKRPNCKLIDNNQRPIGDEQVKMQTPQMRVFEANKILCGQLLPTKFKFREKQVLQIEEKIKSLMTNKKGQVCKIIMITGSPGGGKTMSTNFVMQKLQKDDYKIISLNSNLLKRKHDVQTILAQQLLEASMDEKKTSTFKVINELQKEKNRMKKCILYVEEVQLFFSSHKQVLTEDFFDIFTNRNLKIVMLGISNTIDALEKYCEKLKINVNEVTNIVFNPYTVEQLKEIIIDRLDQVYKVAGILFKFDEKLIRFVANKLNQMKKGDMRMVFQFLKSLSHNIFPSETDTIQQLPQEITISSEVVHKTFTSLNAKKTKQDLIGNIPFHAQIVLIAIYSYLQENQQISITADQLKRKVNQMFEALALEGKKQFSKEIEYLSDYGMVTEKIKVENKGPSVTRYLLKISLGEVKNFFEGHPLLGKLV